MHMLLNLVLFSGLLVISVNGQRPKNPFIANKQSPTMIDESSRWSRCRPTNQSIYDFQVQMLNSNYTDLSQYRGQVLLLVNVATFCAYTQQYLDFNPMVDQNRNGGFTILAFPCNQFYLQEPAENHEILNGVMYVRPGNGWRPDNNLHIYGKLQVNGKQQHPMYEYLKNFCPNTVQELGKRDEMMWDPIKTNDITWNFEKFLIDRQGRVRFRFHPTAWQNGNIVQPFINRLLNERP